MKLNTLDMVHSFLRAYVHPGDFCIDATAGRGRDTALLCELAGPQGKVLAFDIQQEALSQTKQLLSEKGLQARLILDGHENMGKYIEPGTANAIVFNFGRLPGGDPMIFTHGDTSVRAIQSGIELLAPGGVMAIALYYGKENGYSEKQAVLAYLKEIDPKQVSVLCCDWVNRPNDPPMPIFIWKDPFVCSKMITDH